MRIAERLDRLPVLPFHWRLLALCGAGWVLDSIDTGLIGFAMADLIPRWNLSRPLASLLMISAMVGLLTGAAAAGIFADRFGRRPLFLAAPALFSIFSLLCALSWNPVSFALSRFFLGISIASEFPVGAALLSEFAPAARRGRLMVLLDSFWAYGSVLAALSAFLIIPRFGWRLAFLVNVLPAAAVALARRPIPESPRFLVLHGRAAEAEVTVAALERSAGMQVASGAEEPPPPRARLREVLSPTLAPTTLRLWTMWFSMTFVYVGLAAWLPSILVDEGYEMRGSFGFMLAFAVAQIPGYVCAALLIERLGRRWCLTGFTLAAGVCSLLFATAQTPATILLWGCSMSFFNLAAWGVLYAYTGEQFPTRLRASGVGSCVALGRLAGILAPLSVASLLDAPLTGRATVLGLFGLLLLAACVAAWFGRETRGRSLEALHGE